MSSAGYDDVKSFLIVVLSHFEHGWFMGPRKLEVVGG